MFANVQLLENHQDYACYILGPMHQVPVTTIETILPLLAEWTSHIYKHRDDSFLDTLTEKVIIHVFVSVPFTC